MNDPQRKLAKLRRGIEREVKRTEREAAATAKLEEREARMRASYVARPFGQEKLPAWSRELGESSNIDWDELVHLLKEGSRD